MPPTQKLNIHKFQTFRQTQALSKVSLDCPLSFLISQPLQMAGPPHKTHCICNSSCGIHLQAQNSQLLGLQGSNFLYSSFSPTTIVSTVLKLYAHLHIMIQFRSCCLVAQGIQQLQCKAKEHPWSFSIIQSW